MKRIICLFFISVFILGLCSCDSYIEKNECGNTNGEQIKTTILYGITSPDPDKRVLEYNGEPIQIKFNAQNGPTNAEWGLRIYVDGYLQPFVIEDKQYDLYCFELNDRETIDIDLSFIPVIGDVGDELTVNFILYLNPNYVLHDENYVGYDNNHKISQLLPWKLTINNSVGKRTFQNSTRQSFSEIPDKIKNDLSNQFDENKQSIDLLKVNTFVEQFQMDEDYNTVSVHNSSFKTYIRGYGKAEKYRLSLYVNHELVNAFDGKPYCIFEIKDDLMTKVETSVTYDFTNDDNFVYIIAVPISDKYDLYSSDVKKTISMKIVQE